MKSFEVLLSEARQFGIQPGLDAVACVLEALGHPEQKIAAIHIAGTNGKGSVAALCEVALRVAGHRVGRFTSPHLLQVNERILLDGVVITDEELEACAAVIQSRADVSGLSFFELLTVVAFVAFERAGIRLVVLETGLGGRLDATNVVLPLVSVMTRIGLDHCSVLGDSLAAVAAEKAGIIKPGRPVVLGAMPDEAAGVIRRVAASAGAQLYPAEEMATVQSTKRTLYGQTVKACVGDVNLPPTLCRLGGIYQLENIATAFAALTVLQGIGIEIPENAFIEALRTVCWPGRFQQVEEEPPMILDCAHNPDGMRALRVAVDRLQFKGPVGLVCGMCADKDVRQSVAEIAPAVSRVWTVPVPSERGLPPEELRTLFSVRAQAVDSLALGLEQARSWADINNGLLIVAGSIFLAGEVLALTGNYPYGSVTRRDSNEVVSCTK